MLRCRTDLSMYIEQIKGYPLLSREEEVELAIASRLQGPTKSGEPLGRAARDRLICCNTRLVINCARRIKVPGVELDDLVNAGNLGLEKAACRFDPSRGVRFATYAMAWIKNFVFHLVKERHLIHVPHYAQEALFHPGKRKRVGKQYCLEAAQRILEADKCPTIVDSDGYTLDQVDLLAAAPVVPSYETEERDELVSEMLASLSDTQRRVLHLRIWEGQTLQAVAETMLCTREWVRQVQATAVKQLKKSYEFRD